MRIGVLGAGAIGCYLGGKLAASGSDVVFVGRPAMRAEIAEHGLVLTDYTGACVALGRVAFDVEPRALEGCDAILVTVKSLATESAAAPLASILKKRTTLVSFQNGVSNAARLRSVLPAHDVLAGMVPFNVAHRGEGRFHNGTSGPLAIEARRHVPGFAGAWSTPEDGVEAPIARALRAAGFEVAPAPTSRASSGASSSST